jgi:hypothetical protein
VENGAQIAALKAEIQRSEFKYCFQFISNRRANYRIFVINLLIFFNLKSMKTPAKTRI